MIIKLLLVIYTVCARLDLSDIKGIEESSVIMKKGNLLINPDGPLNLLRGYLFHKSGIVYNKRFFSSVINTDYSMKKSNKSTEGDHLYTYRRNPENDKPYQDNNMIHRFKYESTYLSELHQQMIYMFPCANNALSIEPCRNDSFTRFLRVHGEKLDSVYLLAALLLLSEGINVPIKIENTIGGSERLLLKGWSGVVVFIDLPLWLESIMPDRTRKMVYQKETEEILRYFQKLCEEPFLSDAMKCKEPEGRMEFKSGYFLDSPKFLIQSYIFEYIDTIEQYILFVAAVRVLLADLGLYPEKAEEQRELIKKTIACYFIEKEVYKNIAKNYAANIYSLKSKIDRSSILPFTSIEMIPSYTRVPENIPENSADPIQDETLQYSDHVETMLLNLFTCLTYNPETNLCSTENMPGASTALIEFFNKYSVPKESASQTKHRDWCKVVSRLNNPKIRYVRESRAMLCGGLENIIYVIYELFSENTDIRNIIENATNRPYNTAPEIIESIKELFLTVLNYIARNHQISIESSPLMYLTEEGAEGHVFDTFGSITLGFKAGDRKESIKLDILPKYSKFSLAQEFSEISEEAETELSCMQRKYSYIKNYTTAIILNYLNNTIKMVNKKSPEQNQSVLNSMLDKNELNKIFLSGRIGSLDYKTAIVEYFSINKGNRKRLSGNDQFMRVVRNLIGSVPLYNPEERKRILGCLCIFFSEYEDLFVKIEYDIEDISVADINGNLLEKLLEAAGSMVYQKNIFQENFKKLLRHPIYRKEALKIFGPYNSFRALCITLVERYEVSTLLKMMQEMKNHIKPYNAKELNNIWFLWLLYACVDVKYNPKIAGIIYTHLDPTCITVGFIECITKMLGVDFNYILHTLEKEKSSLYTEGKVEDTEKYEKIIDLLKTIIISTERGQLLSNPTTSRKRSHLGNMV
ncbi:hypothetical protein NEIRO02_2436 [Nematocida sp. AWRm79]|nr:hypothetical protein NEIRO02_2436 [Nematocida sp. AWRm79]